MLAVVRIAALGAVLASMLSASSAMAAEKAPPTADQVVARHAELVRNLEVRSGEALARAGETGVNAVNALDAKGAADEKILAAGRRALGRVGMGVDRSLGGVRKVTEGALRTLTRIGASDEVKQSVRATASGAAASIRASGEAAATAIRSAVDAATANE
ncbi:MAG: hypothetical protein JNK58_04735 [Phycisphaerae bacterium]|nr:hypothetical protein [Phycisphaerae bacterium]